MNDRTSAPRDGESETRDETGTERAVAPIFGVILMLAVTVLVVVGLGAFVLTTSDQPEGVPQNVEFEYTQSSDGTSVTIEYRGEEFLQGNRLTTRVDGRNATNQFPGDVGAGTEIEVDAETEQQIEIVYTTEGGSTTVISSWQVPE